MVRDRRRVPRHARHVLPGSLALSLYLFHAENLVVRNIHPESQGCVVCAVYEDHAYIYQKGSKIQDLVRNRVPREIRPLPKWRLKSETAGKDELTHRPLARD